MVVTTPIGMQKAFLEVKGSPCPLEVKAHGGEYSYRDENHGM